MEVARFACFRAVFIAAHSIDAFADEAFGCCAARLSELLFAFALTVASDIGPRARTVVLAAHDVRANAHVASDVARLAGRFASNVATHAVDAIVGHAIGGRRAALAIDFFAISRAVARLVGARAHTVFLPRGDRRTGTISREVACLAIRACRAGATNAVHALPALALSAARASLPVGLFGEAHLHVAIGIGHAIGIACARHFACVVLARIGSAFRFPHGAESNAVTKIGTFQRVAIDARGRSAYFGVVVFLALPHAVAKTVVAARRYGFRCAIVVGIGSCDDVLANPVLHLPGCSLFRVGTRLTCCCAIRVAAKPIHAEIGQTFGAHRARLADGLFADSAPIAGLSLRLAGIVLRTGCDVDARAGSIAHFAGSGAIRVATDAVDTMAALAFHARGARGSLRFLVHARARAAVAICSDVAMRLAGTSGQTRIARTNVRGARLGASVDARTSAIAGVRIELRQAVGAAIRCDADTSRRMLLASAARANTRVPARGSRLSAAFCIGIGAISHVPAFAVRPGTFLRGRASLARSTTRRIAANPVHAKSTDALRAIAIRARNAVDLLAGSTPVTGSRARARGNRIGIRIVHGKVSARSFVARNVARLAVRACRSAATDAVDTEIAHAIRAARALSTIEAFACTRTIALSVRSNASVGREKVIVAQCNRRTTSNVARHRAARTHRRARAIATHAVHAKSTDALQALRAVLTIGQFAEPVSVTRLRRSGARDRIVLVLRHVRASSQVSR